MLLTANSIGVLCEHHVKINAYFCDFGGGSMVCYVYIVKCSDGTLYTGWTTDLVRRLKAHNDGQGAKYTRSRRPVSLVYHEAYSDKIDAQKREWAIKHMTRKGKGKLIFSGTGEGIVNL